jgi:hypothetical protein
MLVSRVMSLLNTGNPASGGLSVSFEKQEKGAQRRNCPAMRCKRRRKRAIDPADGDRGPRVFMTARSAQTQADFTELAM